jgi:hypothetical protein
MSVWIISLQKLFETNSVVEKMKAELVALQPKLVQKSAATAELMKCLLKEQSQADKVRKIVLTDEAAVKVGAKFLQQSTMASNHLFFFPYSGIYVYPCQYFVK